MKQFIKFLISIFIVFIMLNSCNDDVEFVETVNVDAFIRSMEIDGVNKHGLYLYAEANTNIRSVVVSGPNSSTNNLSKYWVNTSGHNSNLFMRLLPNNVNDFSTSLPASGTYSFVTTLSSGKTITKEDRIQTSAIGLIEIDSFSINEITKDIYLDWDEVTDADYYFIKLASDLDEYPYFNSFTRSTGPKDITRNSAAWFSRPNEGDTVVLSLHAYKRETGSINNVASESLDTLSFIW